MKLIPRQISAETFRYQSPQAVDALKADMQQLFEKTRGWDFSVNLYGEFTAADSFEVTPKWQFVHIRGGGNNKIATINGTLFRNDMGKTRVSFTVRPNAVFPIFFFMFPLLGIFTILTNKGNDKAALWVVGAGFIFLVPVLLFFLSQSSKQGLKDRFTGAFNLEPLD